MSQTTLWKGDHHIHDPPAQTQPELLEERRGKVGDSSIVGVFPIPPATAPIHDVGDGGFPSKPGGDADSHRLHQPLVGDDIAEGRPGCNVVLDCLAPFVLAGVPRMVLGGIKPGGNPTQLP